MSYKPKGIVLHLSASPWGDAAVIRKWHTDPEPQGRGWNDIGYHAVILNGRRAYTSEYDQALDGKIEPGRELTVQGAHCHAEGMNGVSLGVCCIGTPGIVPVGAQVLSAGPAFRVCRREYMTRRQFEALIHVCKTWCERLGVDPLGSFWNPRTGGYVPTITQHSDHDPGKPFCASLNMTVFRNELRKRL